MRGWIWSLLILVTGIGLAAAQSADCQAVVQAAVRSAVDVCADLEPNQMCYSHPSVEVEPRENVRLVFAEPGDRVALGAVRSLSSRPLNPASKDWGLTILRLRGDQLDGDLNIVAFGEITLQNGSDAPSNFFSITMTVSQATGANVRALPSPDAPIVQTLTAGQMVRAIGRLQDATWIRIAEGWVSADLLRSRQDRGLLNVAQSDTEVPATLVGPMQIMRFRSGSDDAPCADAPDSGLLLQTTAAVREFNLTVNGAPFDLAGTLWLQTTTEGKTIATLLEGLLRYADGRLLKPGQRLQYGYQGETIVFAAPEPYHFVRARWLPFALLERVPELSFSLSGLVFPFTPGTGFLNNVPADGPCTIAWTGDVNLRSGPGVEYAIRRGVPAGFYALADGRAQAADGKTWWRLAESIWIASDAAYWAGACLRLPEVEVPPLP